MTIQRKYANVLLVFFLLVSACKPYYFRKNFQQAGDLIQYSDNQPTTPYLKAHLQDGKVYVLTDNWGIDTIQNQVLGEGGLYDINRRLITSGPVSVPVDSVAIFETNRDLKKIERDAIGGLSILAGLDVLLSVVCLANPKACFGSCPTFYVNEEDNFHFASAEGFSSAISPSLEYADIDALNYTVENTDSFSIMMKNEALETHCVNQVKLLAAPRGENERVYHAPDDRFYRCDREVLVGRATAEEGDITDLLSEADRSERFSLANEKNLSSKEEILITFDPSSLSDSLGLLFSYRQTQMTTYLFYSAMDYMGKSVSDVFAEIETDEHSAQRLENSIKGELGGIDVYVWSEATCTWEMQGSLNESGPIAFGHQILPLNGIDSKGELKVKLVLNQGLWRIDRVGLTAIRREVTPLVLKPTKILNQGMIDDHALSRINDPENYLISMPGSAYRFSFNLPDEGESYELFLQSRGYYLEWMRDSWRKESNLFKLNQFVNHPKQYLKSEAKAYKQQEASMEAAFWDSKIDTHTFTYYDH